MKYKIDGIAFRSKEGIGDYIRENILYAYADKEPISRSHFDFMVDVLMHHPYCEEKIGAGIQSICSQTNEYWENNRCFYLTRVDGTEIDFSFVKCLASYKIKKKEVVDK